MFVCLAEEDGPGGKGRPEDGGSGKNSTGSKGSKDGSRGSNSNGNWSRGNSDGADWSWAVGRGRGIDGLTRVLDVSNVTIGISGVGDSLETAIGKGNVVLSVGVVSIASLRGTKVSTAQGISDSVVVVVGRDSVGVDGLGNDWAICWGRSCVLGSSSGNSHKSKQSNKALEKKIISEGMT